MRNTPKTAEDSFCRVHGEERDGVNEKERESARKVVVASAVVFVALGDAAVSVVVADGVVVKGRRGIGV